MNTTPSNYNWLEVGITCPSHLRRKKLLDIRTLINDLKSNNLLLYWHVFNEPWATFALRLHLSDYNSIVEKCEKFLLNDTHVFIKYSEYTPEEKEYGDAWPSVMMLFQSASELSLKMAEDFNAPLFSTGKFIHCILNTWGYYGMSEVQFHEEAAGWRRMLTWLNEHDSLDWYVKARTAVGPPNQKEIRRWEGNDG